MDATTTSNIGIKRRHKLNNTKIKSTANVTQTTHDDDDNLQIIKDIKTIKKLKHKHRGLDAATLIKSKDDYARTSLRMTQEPADEADSCTLQQDVTPYSSSFGGISKSTPTTSLAKEDKYLSSFTGTNKTLDATKHMERYIEQEINKHRDVTEQDQQPPTYLDEQALLYAVPDHLRVSSQAVIEGSVTASASMLTSIPEVDLGSGSSTHHASAPPPPAQPSVEKDLAFHNNPYPAMRWRISRRTRETLFDLQFADDLVRDRKGRVVGAGLCTNDQNLRRQIDLEHRLGQVQGGKGVRSIMEAIHSEDCVPGP